jgi:hypothetical protein
MLSVAILAAFICVLVIDAGFGWGKSAASSRQKADLAFDVFNFLGWVSCLSCLDLRFLQKFLTLQIAICVFVIWEFNKHHVGMYSSFFVTASIFLMYPGRLRATGVSSQ